VSQREPVPSASTTTPQPQRTSGSSPPRPSTEGRQSLTPNQKKLHKKFRFSEIFSGPSNVKSLLIRKSFHLTWKVDNSYFTGKAGGLRIFTLFLAVATFGAGLPGYTATPDLYVGYGASPLIPLSMAMFSICILINTVMVFLLLCFREVRCQSKWDDWNTKLFACASAIAAVAGIIELGGIFHTRSKNCGVNPKFSCSDSDMYKNRLQKPTKPELHLVFKDWHYVSVCGKLLCAMAYSFASRIFLKNNDRIHKLKSIR